MTEELYSYLLKTSKRKTATDYEDAHEMDVLSNFNRQELYDEGVKDGETLMARRILAEIRSGLMTF